MLSEHQLHQFDPPPQKNMPWIDTPVKSQIWAAMFVEMSLFWSVKCHLILIVFCFFLTKKHARPNACLHLWGPFNLSGCSMLVYILQRERGKKNLICMTGAVWSQPDMSMDSIAPSIYFFLLILFSNVTFFRAQKKDAKRWFFFWKFCFCLRASLLSFKNRY